MPNSLPFLQDPEKFLRSYFWGCNQGYTLSLRCKQQLDQMRSFQGGGLTPNLPTAFSEQIIELLLDCFVHTKVCSRCRAIEKIACQQGYELIKARDIAFENAFRFEIKSRDDSPNQERVEIGFDMETAQQQLVHHRNGCQECTLKQPRGRYSLAVWNIEAARSQRL